MVYKIVKVLIVLMMMMVILMMMMMMTTVHVIDTEQVIFNYYGLLWWKNELIKWNAKICCVRLTKMISAYSKTIF